MTRLSVLALIAAAGAAAIIAWFAIAETNRRSFLAEGARLYAERCAVCHGKSLEGQPNWKVRLANGRLPAPPHDAGGHTWHHGDAELFTVTRDGMSAIVPGYQSDMPAFRETLSDPEIDAVLAFIKSTWPERERAYQEARTKAEEARD